MGTTISSIVPGYIVDSMTKSVFFFMWLDTVPLALLSAVRSGLLFLSIGVGTHTMTTSELGMQSAGFVVAVIFPFRAFSFAEIAGSSIGLTPELTLLVLCSSTSNP